MTTETYEPINLNLDAEQRSVIHPYKFKVGDRVFTFTDPSELDWQLVETLSTVDALAEHCMSADDRSAFYKTPLAGWKLQILFEDVQKHFKLGEHANRRR